MKFSLLKHKNVHDTWVQNRPWENWYITLVLHAQRIEMKCFLLKLVIDFKNAFTCHVHMMGGYRINWQNRYNHSCVACRVVDPDPDPDPDETFGRIRIRNRIRNKSLKRSLIFRPKKGIFRQLFSRNNLIWISIFATRFTSNWLTNNSIIGIHCRTYRKSG